MTKLNPVQLTLAAERLLERRGIPRQLASAPQLNAARAEIYSHLLIHEAVEYALSIEPSYVGVEKTHESF